MEDEGAAIAAGEACGILAVYRIRDTRMVRGLLENMVFRIRELRNAECTKQRRRGKSSQGDRNPLSRAVLQGRWREVVQGVGLVVGIILCP